MKGFLSAPLLTTLSHSPFSSQTKTYYGHCTNSVVIGLVSCELGSIPEPKGVRAHHNKPHYTHGEPVDETLLHAQTAGFNKVDIISENKRINQIYCTTLQDNFLEYIDATKLTFMTTL